MIDHDAIKLQKLIRRRRKELGLIPSHWRVIFFRLAIIAAAVCGVLL